MQLNTYQQAALSTAVYGELRPVREALQAAGFTDTAIDKIAAAVRVPYGLGYVGNGLAGEAGEVSNKIKKLLRGDHITVEADGFHRIDYDDYLKRKQAIAKELGGVLWYVAALAAELNMSLDDIAKENLAELAARNKADKIRGDGDGNRT